MKRNDGERTLLKINPVRIDSIHCDSVIILVQKKNGWTTSHSGGYLHGTGCVVFEVYRETDRHLWMIFHS